MDIDRDFRAFSALLDDLWAIKGQVLTGGARAAFFNALQEYPLHEVEAGLHAHSRDPERGRFLPMPADIIAQIKGIVANDGRPGAEEAWAVSLRSCDEALTVVWTAEMAEAFGMCRAVLDVGDEIGARMAFKETYTRLVTAAREARRPPVWTASLGFDHDGREAALLPHVQAGRLPADVLPAPRLKLTAVLSLPAPEGATASNLAARAVALERIAQIREDLKTRPAAPSLADVDRVRTDALKAEARAKVEAYIAGAAQ